MTNFVHGRLVILQCLHSTCNEMFSKSAKKFKIH